MGKCEICGKEFNKGDRGTNIRYKSNYIDFHEKCWKKLFIFRYEGKNFPYVNEYCQLCKLPTHNNHITICQGEFREEGRVWLLYEAVFCFHIDCFHKFWLPKMPIMSYFNKE